MTPAEGPKGLSDRTLALLPYGLIALLVAGIAHIGYYNFHRSPERAQAREFASHEPSEQPACMRTDIGGILACLATAAKAEHDAQQRYEELVAQQDMAKSALIVVWISILGVAVSLAGVIVIHETLRETRKMTIATRDIGQQQSAAYVSTPSMMCELDSTDAAPRLTLTLVNSGITPAKAIEIFAEASIETWGDIQSHKRPEGEHHAQFVTPLAANETREVRVWGWRSAIALTEYLDAREESDADPHRVIGSFPAYMIRGFIRYADVYGQVYESDFAFCMDQLTYGSFPLAPLHVHLPTYVKVQRN